MRFSRIVFIGLALLSGSCAQKSEPLRVYGNTTTLEVAPLLLAVDTYYPEAGPVRTGGIPRLLDQPGVPSLESEGLADVATHAETQALRYSVDRPDIRIILTVAEGHYRIIARRSAGIEHIEDLAGKTVGTIPNTSSAFFLEQELVAAGIQPDTVEVLRVSPLSTMPEAILNGEVDAITIWEPTMEKVAQALGDDAVSFPVLSGYREIFNLNTTQEVLDDPARRAQLVKLVEAVMLASRDIKEDAARARTLVVEASGFPADLVDQAWPHQTYPANIASDLLDIMVAEEAWLSRLGERSPRNREALSILIDDSIYEEAKVRIPD